MTSDTLNTSLHTTLESLSKTPAGFSASEVTGFSPEQVRRAAQALVGVGRLHRANVSPRRVRYFADEALARAYMAKRPSAAPQRMVAGARTKASWSADEPGLITPQTKIIRAVTPKRSVFRTNTYLQF